MTDQQPEPLIRANELEAIGAESSLARAMAAHTIRLLYKENEALRARLAQPEPVAVWELQEGGWDTIADADWMETLPVGTKLYTTPPKKEWVGLTHEEQEELSHSFREIINSIDWKLKKKNGGSHD